MRKHIERGRLLILLLCITLLLGAISWRVFDLAYNRHVWYVQKSQAQASGSDVLLRGNIYLSDATGQDFLVATNRKFPALVLTPSKMNLDGVDTIATIASANPQELLKIATGGAAGSRVAVHHLTDAQAGQIKALALPGMAIGYETDRYYPAGNLAADAIGFLGYDQTGRHGQYGVESSYEQELSGTPGAGSTASRWNPFTQIKEFFGASPGTDPDPTNTKPQDVTLTIDKNIQAYAQTALDGVLKKYSAASGLVIIQEPVTGKILAMVDHPTYDPNLYATTATADFLNTPVQAAFEPGSSFKPFTMAMALDLGKITPSTTYNDVDDVVVDGYTIKNYNEGHFGRVTMTQVLEKSINSGTMYVQSLLTHDQFLNYVINEGFAQKTGIDLPGEASGDIGNLYTGRPINFMTASFGQGITVTPIQMVNGYSAIANGGKLMRPYVVASVRDDHGTVTATEPKVMGTPFTAKTAATLRTMLVSVVDKGFDKARIPHYDVAGKTGTAQIADPVRGGYLEKQYNHSFVGFAPASDPRFVIFIKMEKPQGITFAADSLSPTFKDIAQFLLNYLNVPPTR